MQYEFNLPCAAQYELDLTAAPDAVEDTRFSLQPARPMPVDPAPASSRAG